MHESDRSKKCLYVGNFGIVSIVCSASTAYKSLCRGLKYLLEKLYFILILTWPKLWFLRLFFSAGRKHCSMSHKKDRHLSLVTYIFTKYEQNLCLINIHNIPDVTASYGKSLDFIALLGIFLYYRQPLMSELFYLHQTFTDYVCNNVHILVFQHAKCDCRLWLVLWSNAFFFWQFSYIILHVWNVRTSSNF